MMLEGHIPDGSDFLYRLDVVSVMNLHPVIAYLLKFLFYNTSKDNNRIHFAQSTGPGSYRHSYHSGYKSSRRLATD